MQSQDFMGKRLFDHFFTVKSLSFNNGAMSPIDLCGVEQIGVPNIYVTDLDGSMKPSTWPSVVSPASVISLQPNMLQFVDQSKCMSVQSNCYSYCQDTCFRGVLFQADPSFLADHTLKICQTANPLSCILIQAHRRSLDFYYYKH